MLGVQYVEYHTSKSQAASKSPSLRLKKPQDKAIASVHKTPETVCAKDGKNA